MKKLYIIAERPPHIPKWWIICNAPRPITGTETWEGDFRHGIFYAAIDPADEFAEMNAETNRKLDAYEIMYYTEARAREILKLHYPRYAEKIETFPADKIAESFHNVMNRNQ